MAWTETQMKLSQRLGGGQARAWLNSDALVGAPMSDTLCGKRSFFGNHTILARIAALYCS
ncbi:MAG: hypothetical protein C0517_06680 [Erythrobacter sp.]|nr:hypothetical protein [Erythrobacter sp.]